MRRCLPVIVLMLLPAPVMASRVVSISVELDGKQILRGSTGDDGLAGPPIVWRYLNDRPLRPVAGYVVQPQPGRPTEAVLRGKLRVSLRYGADVETDELRLLRDSPQSDAWLIDPDWVEANAPPGDLNEESRRLEQRRWKQSLDVGVALRNRAKISCRSWH